MKIEKVQQFIEKVAEATYAGKVEWEQEDKNYFKTRLGPGFVTLHQVQSEHEWEEPDYVVGFRDRKDEFIIAFADTDFKGLWPDAFKVLQTLFREVRLEVIGFDDFLNGMDADLNKKGA